MNSNPQNGGRRGFFLDRDGVLNEPPQHGARYITAPDQVRLLPGVAAGIERFRRQGYMPLVVTNQRCVALGLVSQATLDQIHERLRELLRAEGTDVEDIFVCPHDDQDRCDCRKPKPGLLHQAAIRHGIDLSQSLLIGDSERDIAAGQSVSCRTILLGQTSRDDWTHTPDITALIWNEIHPGC